MTWWTVCGVLLLVVVAFVILSVIRVRLPGNNTKAAVARPDPDRAGNFILAFEDGRVVSAGNPIGLELGIGDIVQAREFSGRGRGDWFVADRIARLVLDDPSGVERH